MNKSISRSDVVLYLRGLTLKRLGNFLTTRLSMAIKHLPDKERYVSQVFRKCVILIFLLRKSKKFAKRIFCMLEFPQKNNWTTFLDKLSTSNNITSQNMEMTILLFKISVQELILKEKACRPFWTRAYLGLSEKLPLHIKTGYAGSHLNCSNQLLIKQGEKSWCLTKTTTSLQKKNYQTICSPSSMSSIVDKWEKENTKPKLKSLKIQLYPTKSQIQKLEEIFNIYRYSYNKALEYIKKRNHYPDFEKLRNLLISKKIYEKSERFTELKEEIKKVYLNMENDIMKEENEEKKKLKDIPKKQKEQIKNIKKEYKTKIKNIKEYSNYVLDELKGMVDEEMKKGKLIRNPLVKDFEIKVSKEIRSNAVKNLCNAIESAKTNLRNGKIKYFQMKFKKRNKNPCAELAKTDIKLKNDIIQISKNKLKNDCEFQLHKNTIKRLNELDISEIKHNCDLVRQKNKYYILIPIDFSVRNTENKDKIICGVDPGLRTFLTVVSNHCISEYNHDRTLIKKLNKKIDALKNKRKRKKQNKKSLRKKALNKLEEKKINIINELHWKSINDLTDNNDIILFGDIKSHDIVKGGKNKYNNREFNDYKFYKFKQRLKYICHKKNKILNLVNEANTTKGCSNCGNLCHTVEDSEIYKCIKCKFVIGRDINSGKNMLMKGILF